MHPSKLKLNSYCNCFWIVRANKKRLGTPFKIVFRLSVCQYTTKAMFSSVGERPGWTDHVQTYLASCLRQRLGIQKNSGENQSPLARS